MPEAIAKVHWILKMYLYFVCMALVVGGYILGSVLLPHANQGEHTKMEIKDPPPASIHKVSRANNTLYLETHVLNGVKNGVEKAYYSDGNLMRTSNYKDGVLHGLVVMWDERGTMLYSGEYREGMPYDGTFLLSERLWRLEANDLIHPPAEFKRGIRIR